MLKPTDNLGLPGSIGLDGQFDGGDTAAILGTIQTLSPSASSAYLMSYLLGENAPVRHPDKSKWYGQEDRFSRDQLIAIICAGIVSGQLSAVERIFQWHKKHWFLFAWNWRKNGGMETPRKWYGPDITFLEVWGLWLRYKNPKWARAILWLCDLHTLIGAVQWRYFSSSQDRVTRNHMLVSFVARHHMPTFVSKFTYWFNDWSDLINRWYTHCEETKEYQTADLMLLAYITNPG